MTYAGRKVIIEAGGMAILISLIWQAFLCPFLSFPQDDRHLSPGEVYFYAHF